MERQGYIPSIQGGGSGAGFAVPDSLTYDETKTYDNLIKTIIQRGSQAEEICKSESNKEKMTIWNSALTSRLFMLKPIRNNRENSRNESDMSPGRNFKIQKRPPSALSVLPQVFNANRITFVNRKPRKHLKTVAKHETHHTNYSIVKVVPRMRRSIDDVVRLWRFGCAESSSMPIRRFRSAAFRKQNIDGYSNMACRKGQKELLQRFCGITSILSE